MPFTFAHPAAVLPIRRALPHTVVLSAMVIGAMSPDFVYMVPASPFRMETHGPLGSLVFCLPAGLLVYVVYHLLLKEPLADLLPGRVGGLAAIEVARHPGLPRCHWALVVLSVWIGALTHIGWDAFTHEHSPIVQAIPFLQRPAFHVRSHVVPVCRVLQHASTIVGLLAIGLAVKGALGRLPAIPAERSAATALRRAARITGLVLIPPVTALAWCRDSWFEVTGMGALQVAVFRTVTHGLALLVLVLVFDAVLWHLGASRGSAPDREQDLASS